MINPMDLSGKHILVAGASSGIGQGVAIYLSQIGASVSIISRNMEKLQLTLGKMQGKNHHAYAVDFSQLDTLEATYKTIVEEMGPVDGFVYSVGIDAVSSINLLKPTRLAEIMTVNFGGFVESCRILSKKGKFFSGASFVGISSIAATQGEKAMVAYCAAKAALEASVRCMAREFGTKGIRVNAVRPGWVNTQMYANFIEKTGADKDDWSRQFMGICEPKDVAGAVAYLLSDMSAKVTGTTITVDGGSSV